MSTIKVDTYQTRGGASEIAIDKLKGVSSAGSMLVVAEGGTTTTNLQQGLAKAWNHYDQKGDSGSTQILDSFNISSVSDDQTGVSTHLFANDMNNNFSSTTALSIDRDTRNLFTSGPETTLHSDKVQISCLNTGNSLVDPDSVSIITCGDLA